MNDWTDAMHEWQGRHGNRSRDARALQCATMITINAGEQQCRRRVGEEERSRESAIIDLQSNNPPRSHDDT